MGNADQRSKIGTFNISPTYTRVISNNSVFNLGAFVRKDLYNYYPSGNPLADLGPSNLQTSSISQIPHSHQHRGPCGLLLRQRDQQPQDRRAVRADFPARARLAWAWSIPPTTRPASTSTATRCLVTPDPIRLRRRRRRSRIGNYLPVLAPYDLTRGGTDYNYFGHTDVKELALYIEDQIKAGNWHFNLGLREDLYNGLTDANQTEPRVGIAYNIKPTGTVLSVSYARTLETPFNENLVLSSSGCSNAVLAPLLACTPGRIGNPSARLPQRVPRQPAAGLRKTCRGQRRVHLEVHPQRLRLQRAGQHAHHLPHRLAQLQDSRLCAPRRGSRGPRLQRLFVTSSVAARFFPPQSAGAGAPPRPGRIIHSASITTRSSTRPRTFSTRFPRWQLVNGLWGGFNWRYDSGLVAGSVPCYNVTDPNSLCSRHDLAITPGGQPGVDLSGLTADEQFEAGITCNGVTATLTSGFTSCDAQDTPRSWSRFPRPAPRTTTRTRRASRRAVFSTRHVGKNNLFHKEHFKTDLDLTAINVTNKYALYNFLSTFSGTHYVTPRALTAKVTFNF